MSPQQAISLIQKAIKPDQKSWADIGAGTGTFTLALRETMASGVVYAVDKNPHALWRLPLNGEVEIKIVEGDFAQKMELPEVDNILMANALHYAADHTGVLENVLAHLKPGGQFLLIEYETEAPLPPWIPHPLPFKKWQEIAVNAGLSAPVEIGRAPSQYGHQHIYAALSKKEGQ